MYLLKKPIFYINGWIKFTLFPFISTTKGYRLNLTSYMKATKRVQEFFFFLILHLLLTRKNNTWSKVWQLMYAIYTEQKHFRLRISSVCDQILRGLWIWSLLMKKSLMKNFVFRAVIYVNSALFNLKISFLHVLSKIFISKFENY